MSAMRSTVAVLFFVITMLASMVALGCSGPISASDPEAGHADAEAEAKAKATAKAALANELSKAVAVQVTGGLTTMNLDLPAVQSYCRAQSDQHYDDCVTVRQVLDTLAGDCEDCRSTLGYRYSETTGRVVRIDLDSKGLSGIIPPEIGNLAALEWLSLGSNELTGPIPPEIGNLTALEWLSLGSNELTGPIPSEIGSLTSLESLWLYGNRLTGSIPPEIGNLTNLENLALSSNQLTGPIPLELGKLTNLDYLSLDSNRLTGCVPESLQEAYSGNDYPICGTALQTPFNLPAVQSHCRAQVGQHYDDCVNAQIVMDALAGDCEDCRSTLGYRYSETTGRVVRIDLDSKELSGIIPPEIGNLAALEWLSLGSNELTGPIPPEIGNLTALEWLSLGSNELTGPIPSEIGSLTSLESLWLYGNRLTGSIPPEIGNLTNLENLALSSNQLTGPIPLELGKLTNLDYLSLDSNRLTGCVPESLQEAYSGNDYPICGTALQTPTPTPNATPSPTPTPTATVSETCGNAVTDSSNTGLVSDCNTLLGMKDVLRGSAALNWSTSTSIARWDGITLGGSPQRVTKVKLNSQKERLDGHIPAEIGELAMLEELWLHNNRLSGTLPPELGDLGNLSWLFLSNNELSGQIPQDLNKLKLDRFWIHKNGFTGCVPYNLTLTREYKVESGLPACAPPTGSPTPTPTPVAGTPTPTPTPAPGATPPPTPTAEPGDTSARLTAIEGRLDDIERRLAALETVVAGLTGTPSPSRIRLPESP